MPPKYSLTEGSIPREGYANVVMFLLFGVIFGFSMASTVLVAQCVGANAIWWSFPLASVISVAMSSSYYRYGARRKVRLGVTETRPAPSGGAPATVAGAPNGTPSS